MRHRLIKPTILTVILFLILLLASCSKCKKNDLTTDDVNYPPMLLNICEPELGAVPDDGKDDSEPLKNAIEKSKGFNSLICFPVGEYKICSDITVPSNVTLRFEKGAYLNIPEDITVSLDGCCIEAERQQIFMCEGNLSGHSSTAAYPQWFGASGNGKKCSKSIQNIVDVFDTLILTSDGNSTWCFDGISIKKPTEIIGEGCARVPIHSESSNDLFIISSCNVSFKNIVFTGSDNHRDHSVFYFDTSESNIENILIENCFATKIGHGIKDSENGNNHVSKIRVTSCQFSWCFNEGIYITDFSEGISFEDVVVTNLGGIYVTHTAWYVKNVKDMYMFNVDAAGNLGNGEHGDGFVFENCSNIEIQRGMQDYVNGNGVVLRNCSNLYFNNMMCSLYEGYGFYMENVTDSTFCMILANGIYPTVDCLRTRGTVYEAIKLVGCSNLTFNSVMMTANQSDGMVIEDCNHITVNALSCPTGKGKTAYIEQGSSDYNSLNGASAVGQKFVQVGSHSVFNNVSVNYEDAVSKTGPYQIGK